MRRSLAVVSGLAAAGMLASVAAQPAAALTRSEARQAAIAASTARQSNGDLIIFGLPRPLRARQSVSLATPRNLGIGAPSAAERRRLRPLGRRTWLFWEDLVPGAGFVHPSRVILVDDRTGRVRVRPTGLYPLVDGRRPAFLASRARYNNRRWQVFRRIRQPARATAAQNDLRREHQPLPISSVLGDHCIYMIGAFEDPQFKEDFKAIRDFGRQSGIRTYHATRRGLAPTVSPPPKRSRTEATVSELTEDIRTLRSVENCKDILFYVAGHGYPAKTSARKTTAWYRTIAPRLTPLGQKRVIEALNASFKLATAQPTVQISDGGSGDPVFLTERALKLALEEANKPVRAGTAAPAPPTTFKFKVQACFAGRFLNSFRDNKNVLMTEASSAAHEPSFGWMGGLRTVSGPKNPMVSEFTWANIVGWNAALKDPAAADRISKGESAIVAISAVGWAKAHGVDRAEWLGFTSSQFQSRRDGKPTTLTRRGTVPGSNPAGQAPPKGGGGELVPITPPPIVIPPG